VTCDELHALLHGYVDGELELSRHLDVERHLGECPDCALDCKRLEALRAALRGRSFRFTAPSGLAPCIQRSLRKQEEGRGMRRVLRRLAMAAAAALIVAAVWGAVRYLPARLAEDRIAREVVASHVRSLMADHLTDVASSNQHRVKPWFLGKVDVAPTVLDLSEQGFTLIGGRLDYVDDRPAAALVYRCRQHVINLLVWSSPGATDDDPKELSRQGYQMFRWRQDGRTCWAVSDLNSEELGTFVDLVKEHGRR